MEGYDFKPIRFTIPCLVCGEEIEVNINDPNPDKPEKTFRVA